MMGHGPDDVALTRFQLELSRLFFSVPASRGFLLAGGAALAAHRLTSRHTQDLDLFTSPGAAQLTVAEEQFGSAAVARGLVVQRIRRTETFCRLLISRPGQDEVLVDLAVDSTPVQSGIDSVAGPTFALTELAGRKVVALFDRAEARDFADVNALAKRFSKDELLEQAGLVDRGFDRLIFAQMVSTLSRFTDTDLPVPAAEIADLRNFFARWAVELTEQDL